MPTDETNVSAEDQTVEATATTEDAAVNEAPQEQSVQEESSENLTEESNQQSTEEVEEVDLDKYMNERYPAQSVERNDVDDVAKQLAQLPTDEAGNVEADAAAKWFADFKQEVIREAEQRAQGAARNVFDADAAEKAQQQALLKEYPDITKDKGTLDMVFDLRDAAALRGDNVTLLQAAEKLGNLRTTAKKEGQQNAYRQTSTQAAAHLETSSTKGNNNGEEQRLAAQALQGSGVQAKEARHALLKQFVEREMKEGRIDPLM